MIGAIVRKELLVLCRDGRVLALVGLIGALTLLALLTAWATHVKHERQVRQSQAEDSAAFLQQGSKPSHSAAHFGRMAYKPPAALAIFDPGAAPYLGQVIWLEAHRQDPAMFRPAADAPELSRLADLSIAGVLTSLLPLLAFVMGHGVFAGERERGTLRQVMAAGAGHGSIFAGKLIAVGGVGVCVAFVVIAVATTAALIAGEGDNALDTIVRGTGLFAGFAAYACAMRRDRAAGLCDGANRDVRIAGSADPLGNFDGGRAAHRGQRWRSAPSDTGQRQLLDERVGDPPDDSTEARQRSSSPGRAAGHQSCPRARARAATKPRS